MQQYTVIGEMALNAEQLIIGFTRLLYPFFAGLLLSRLGFKISLHAGFWWCSLLIIGVLLMPRIDGESAHPECEYTNHWLSVPYSLSQWQWKRVGVFPANLKKCSFLGNISYPLYIVHYPIVFTLLGAWKTNNPDISLSTTIFVNVATFLFCLAVAYATLKLYDGPVRKWLKQHWFMSKREYKQTTAKLKIQFFSWISYNRHYIE